MISRKDYEIRERKFLSPYATLSAESKGRKYPEKPCDIRTVFQQDRDRIIHSKAFRRLKHKTQVFISPEGDHYRTRLTHTLEVAGIARTIARGLALNEDLTEAIALGHDLGHTPFGHAGEEALNQVYPPGFRHNEQSLRVVDFLEVRSEKNIRGLNLTDEVRDGILNHTGPQIPYTLEGQIVRIADRIAYINHDIDDAIRGGVIKYEDLPSAPLKVLGRTHSERIDLMVKDIIKSSWNQPVVRQSPEVEEATNELRYWLFVHVYQSTSKAKTEEGKAKWLLQEIYAYYLNHPEQLPKEYQILQSEVEIERIVVDYIAGMTDRYALAKANQIFFPKPWLG
ncbi:deoxyguanosinetriphosphate triphosphohydrolase [Anoxybacter fermentans]|uniref:Deoxyguanosinetriphosphate triphosphohydrolase-like protein n=1 Tax=Anoxybacter fermentans TaxID=1323375 RepID=A0A3S9SXW5_9FIRM|nr:deoxyguanosinetriphosphate triphosphohydrolase [Anoxybacter fermentans]AZR73141.1 deoxyguanosinetriphosphate triphosphohydrolase [Anoxybacter fermentans]